MCAVALLCKAEVGEATLSEAGSVEVAMLASGLKVDERLPMGATETAGERCRLCVFSRCLSCSVCYVTWVGRASRERGRWFAPSGRGERKSGGVLAGSFQFVDIIRRCVLGC